MKRNNYLIMQFAAIIHQKKWDQTHLKLQLQYTCNEMFVK